MTLKTLKDLNYKDWKCYDDYEKWFSENSLKQEAIKWVKSKFGKSIEDAIQIDWIMHFFNITPQELENA